MPATCARPSGEHDVGRRALEQLTGDQPRLSRHLARGARDGRARHRCDATRDRAVAVAQDGGVAAHDDDPLRVHAELGRAHLRKGRLVRLALRRHADLEIDHSARVDPDVGALERADTGALQIGRQPDTDRPRRGAPPLLRGTPFVVPEAGEQAVERGVVVGRIVDDRYAVTVPEPGGVGHLVEADEVATP
jgi:hypothetical protein